MATANHPTSRSSRRLGRIILLVSAVLLVLALLLEGYVALTGGRSVKTENFIAATLDGKTWSLAEHRGKRPVVLSFFATWCAPCKIEYPHLLALQKKYGPDGVQVVLLTDEPTNLVKKFPEYTKPPLTYIPNAGAIMTSYGVESIPHTVVFNREGQIAKQFQGYSETVPAEIEKLVK